MDQGFMGKGLSDAISEVAEGMELENRNTECEEPDFQMYMDRMNKEQMRREWEVAVMRGFADKLIKAAKEVEEMLPENPGKRTESADYALVERYRRLVETAATALISCYGKRS